MNYLDNKEKSILSVLFKTGPNIVTNLSKETLINRTTLYPILEKLLSKGLVSKVKMEGRTYFKAITIKDFEEWIRTKKKDEAMEISKLETWVKNQRNNSDSLVSEVAYFEGIDGTISFFNDSWRDNPEKLICGFSDYSKILSSPIASFFINDFLPTRIKKGITFRGIISPSEKAHKDSSLFKSRLQHIRYLKGLKDLGIGINVYNDKLAIVDYDDKKLSAVLIKNKKIAKAFKNIFDYAWSQGKELS